MAPDAGPKKRKLVPRAKLERFRRVWEELRADSANARAVRDEIEQYVMPRVGSAVGISPAQGESTATWKNPDRWDHTAPAALAKLAAHIHGSVTPAGTQWFGGAFPSRELNADKTSKEWIEGNAKLLWQAVEESDFQSEIASGLEEYVGPGNAIVTQEVDDSDGRWGGLDYTNVPAAQCEFEEDSRGGMKTWYRLLSWTPVQQLDRFGPDGVPEEVRKQVESGTGANTPEDVLYVVFERTEVTAKAPNVVALPELRPYGSVYFRLRDCEQLGDEGGLYDRPAFIARWGRVPGSRWAYGLGHVVLPSVKFVNAWLEVLLTAGAKALDPPGIGTEDGIMSDPDMRPGGWTTVRSIEDLKILQHEGRFDVGQALLADQRAEIRRLFREDALDLKDSPQMTAMEAQLRYDIMLKLLGPPLARFQSEFLDQMLLGAYRAMYRAGKFPPAPPLVREKGEEFNFVYLGPTARARRTDRVAAQERGASYVAGLRKMGFEDVKHVFRPIQSVREVFEDLGIPSTVLASEAEVKRSQGEERDLMQRMARAQTAQAEGAAVQQGAAAAAAASQVSATEPMPAAPLPILNPPLTAA